MSATHEERYRRALEADVAEADANIELGVAFYRRHAITANRTRGVVLPDVRADIEYLTEWRRQEMMEALYAEAAIPVVDGAVSFDPAAGFNHPDRAVRLATLRRLGGAA